VPLLLPRAASYPGAPLLLHAPRRDAAAVRLASAASTRTPTGRSTPSSAPAASVSPSAPMTYDTPELAARAYDAAAWRIRRPRLDLDFLEMEFLAPPPCLSPPPPGAAPARHRRAPDAMQQWRVQFPSNVRDEEDFYTMQRAERRADRRRRRAFGEVEIDNRTRPSTTRTRGGTAFGPRPPATTSRLSSLFSLSFYRLN
jgi:hypothetical protein